MRRNWLSHALFFSFPHQTTLIVDVWDDDSELNNTDDLIDQFIIPILDTVSGLYKSESKTLIGIKGIGKLTIAYYNFTIHQKVPSYCSSADIPIITNPKSTSKTSIYLLGDSNILCC